MDEDDAASVSREIPALLEGGDELEGPPHFVQPANSNCVAEQNEDAEEGGGETNASTGNGSAASKAASATSRVLPSCAENRYCVTALPCIPQRDVHLVPLLMTVLLLTF